MIEKEQREAERRPVTKITHKGEIEIENQEPAKAPEALVRLNELLFFSIMKPYAQFIVRHVSFSFQPEPVPNIVEVSEEKTPESKVESPKKAKDTTSLHKSHLFDLYCKICTGEMFKP